MKTRMKDEKYQLGSVILRGLGAAHALGAGLLTPPRTWKPLLAIRRGQETVTRQIVLPLIAT
jgi:hypothetical protein